MTINEKVTKILSNSVIRTKMNLAEELGISRPTLDARLKTGNWKKLEIKFINYVFSKLK